MLLRHRWKIQLIPIDRIAEATAQPTNPEATPGVGNPGGSGAGSPPPQDSEDRYELVIKRADSPDMLHLYVYTGYALS